ncbi:MAG: glycosyltransferase family 39 protein [Acidobacteria bacterium]|nr:glycosyltransferase family 39 protein [Acidobacteriota bacterium]
MLRRLIAAAIFFIILFGYAWHAGQAGLAAGYIDPVGKIVPQDEALYSSIALRMAERGDWLTPHFMGRLALFKPPLVYWASAASVRLFGDTVLSLRLPSLFAGALVPALLFYWIGGARGVIAAGLLAAHPLWFTLARLNLTDALLGLWITLAAVSLWKDSRTGFVFAAAAAILTKGIAGLTPIFIWALWTALTRVSPRRWLPAVVGSLALASPWFLYQLAVHPKWFWAEFVQVEILGFSLGSGVPQTTQESQILFYAKRLWMADPLVPVLVACALVALWRGRQDGRAPLLAAWMIVVLGLAAANSYRNVAYVLAGVPAMCWIAAEYAPWRRGRWDWVLAGVVLCAVVPVRALHSRMEPRVAATAWLQRYAALQRPNPLVSVDGEEELVAATLGLPRLHYLFVQPESTFRRYGLDFRYLGIALRVDEFLRRRELMGQFEQRLREWQVPSTEAVGSVIAAPAAEDVRRLIADAPEVDFFIPGRLRGVAGGSHELREAGSGVFLLSGVGR